MLHGSFLIFSENYINDFDGLNPNTYMYMEENILRMEMLSNNKIMLYSPDIIVFHEEDCSTDEKYSSNRKKVFKFSNSLKSMEVLWPLLKDYWDIQNR